MITFCIKMEEQNKACILHISWVLAKKFSLHERPHDCSKKKYLSSHYQYLRVRSSGLLEVNKQLHLSNGTTQTLYLSIPRTFI